MWKSYPQDLSNGTLGIKLPFNSPKKGSKIGLFSMSYSTEEQAISNYINLLLTKKGERYMQPNFGIGIYSYLFENNTPDLKIALRSIINEQSSIWLPYIFNKDIIINDYTFSGDSHQAINIKIIFSVTELGANRVINLFPNSINNSSVNVEII